MDDDEKLKMQKEDVPTFAVDSCRLQSVDVVCVKVSLQGNFNVGKLSE